MTPYDRARLAYDSGPAPAVPWSRMVQWFAVHGGLVSSPTAFILARRVRRQTPLAELRHLPTPRPLEFPAHADTWHIYLAAGNLREAAVLLRTYPLPFLSWFRRDGDRLRVIPSDRFLALACHDQAEDHRPP